MSTYAANPAGLGVSKRYGALGVGGVGGEYATYGANREIVFEITAGETQAGLGFTLPLPANYRVETIYYEVETAFAASSTCNVAIGGGAALTTPISLATAVAVTSVALTGLANTSALVSNNVVFSVNANGIASTTGKARVYVQFKAV
jgi:hypothetical protein